MKKGIGLLIVILLSLFVNINKVEGRAAMYLKCYMNESNCLDIQSCNESIGWDTFVIINNGGGDPTRAVINSTYFYYNQSGNNDDFFEFFWKAPFVGYISHSDNACWFQDINDIDKGCDEKNVPKLSGGIGNFNMGQCPLGLRAYKKDAREKGPFAHFKVPAGVTSVNESVDFITNDEVILYKINNIGGYEFKNIDVYIMEAYKNDGTYAFVVHPHLKGEVSKSDLKSDNDSYNALKFSMFSGISPFLYNNDPFYAPLRSFLYFSDGHFGAISLYISPGGVSQLIRLSTIENKEDYYKVSSNFGATLASIAIGDENSITKIFDSTESGQENLKKEVLEWYKSNEEEVFKKYEKLLFLESDRMKKLLSYSNKLIDSVENDKTFTFDNDYNINTMLDDLKYALEQIEIYSSFDNEDDKGNNGSMGDISSMVTYYIMSKYFDVEKELSVKSFPSYIGTNNEAIGFGENVVELNAILYRLIHSVCIELDSDGEMLYFELQDFYESLRSLNLAVNYLSKYSSDFALSPSQLSILEDLRGGYSIYGEKYDVNVAVDCRGLIGEELLQKINNILNIFKIAVPIMLVGFGVFDFFKAVFANDESKMKAAQMDFLKRVGIAIIIFLVPTLVTLILKIANEVWSFISPDSCGIFS